MKNLATLVFGVLCVSNLVRASEAISAEFGVCVEFGSSLAFRMSHERKGLPTSWDDFEKVRIMKRGTMKHQLFTAKTSNSFALVPGAPVIQNQTGIPREYSGYRLVLISRKEGTSKSSGTGRCALLADPGRENSKQFPVYPVFFPEDLAQIILKQIDGFDPQKQPLAFDDLSPFELEAKQAQKNTDNTDYPLPPEANKEEVEGRPNQGTGRSNLNSLHRTANVKASQSIFEWIIAISLAVIVLGLALWLRLRKSKTAS